MAMPSEGTTRDNATAAKPLPLSFEVQAMTCISTEFGQYCKPWLTSYDSPTSWAGSFRRAAGRLG
jgi:hypothetical protein